MCVCVYIYMCVCVLHKNISSERVKTEINT